MFNKKENYRDALIKIQGIQAAGGWIRFGDIKKQFNLCSVSRKNLIPDLTGMDLNDDAVVDRLYTEQEEYLKKCRAEASSRSLNCYHKMKDKVADLEAENARLRYELEVAKSNRKK